MNGPGECVKIGQVVRLRQIARRWLKLTSACKSLQSLACKLLSLRLCRLCYVFVNSDNGHCRSLSTVPPDVPSGHLAVYVGQQCNKRFVIRAAYLNHPMFRTLLKRAEEEFGFGQQGVLAIPCDELLFEHILRFVGCRGNDSRPLLDEFNALLPHIFPSPRTLVSG